MFPKSLLQSLRLSMYIMQESKEVQRAHRLCGTEQRTDGIPNNMICCNHTDFLCCLGIDSHAFNLQSMLGPLANSNYLRMLSLAALPIPDSTRKRGMDGTCAFPIPYPLPYPIRWMDGQLKFHGCMAGRPGDGNDSS